MSPTIVVKGQTMITDELGQALHDKSTRGGTLSSEESKQLENWYNYHDNLERQRFSAVMHMKSQDTTTEKLRSQIEATLMQLGAMTKRIQEIAAEMKCYVKKYAVYVYRSLALL